MELKYFKKILLDFDIPFSEIHSHFIISECPNCNGKDKLWVDKNKLLWQCWKCKGLDYDDTSKGNLYTFLKKVLQLDYFEIKNVLKENEKIEYVPEVLEYIPEAKQPVKDEEIVLQEYTIPSYFYLLDCSEESIKKYPEAYSYLIKRHIKSRKQILSFNLRYNPAEKRLVFPAFNRFKKCLGVQTRDITERHKISHLKCSNPECNKRRVYYFYKTKEEIKFCPACNSELSESFYPKSSNSKNFPKTEFFFNEQNIDWTKPVVLVEGPFDCINTPNAMGLLGRTLSYTQLNIIIENLKSSLILYLDGDKPGTQSTIDVYHKVSIFVNDIKICYLEDGQDPGGFDLDTNSQNISNAITPHQWFIKKQILY